MARKHLAAVDSATGQIDYHTGWDDADPLPYGYDGGLSPQQVRRVYDRRPDKRTEKDDGAGNIIAKTAAEIAAYDAAIEDAETEQGFDPDALSGKDRKLMKLLFTMANMIRTNNGQSVLSKAQFINFVKGL